jgi:hypothetical protein
VHLRRLESRLGEGGTGDDYAQNRACHLAFHGLCFMFVWWKLYQK